MNVSTRRYRRIRIPRIYASRSATVRRSVEARHPQIDLPLAADPLSQADATQLVAIEMVALTATAWTALRSKEPEGNAQATGS